MLIPMVMAVLAAFGVLIFFYAVVGARKVDPVQARLSQLGSMQARTLEEIELQEPLFERTLRPLATRLSGVAQRFASPQKVSRTETRLAMAGNPGALRTVDFLGLKLVVAALLGGGTFVPGCSRGARCSEYSRPAPSAQWASSCQRCG
jgi:hypothetical protein